MAKKLTLGAKERLKSRKAIGELFSRGQRLTVPLLRAAFTTGPGYYLRLGVGVSSKQFRKAVDRNRVKRLVREAYRTQKTALQTELKKNNRGMNIFLTYTGQKVAGYTEITASLQHLLGKLINKANENDSAGS